jgi:hypothetical protein
MDILERLSRIERLEKEQASAQVLLEEVRGLLAEAEVWVRSEAHESERANAAVAAFREALARDHETVRESERTLVA